MKEGKQSNRELGSRYESIAASYLEEKGYQILERNYRSRRGEIDLIALDSGTIVFIEVKYRSERKKGDPLEAVGWRKQSQICRTARVFLMERQISPDQACRFDVVGILGGEITLIQNAFEFHE
ncbi:MAG: YraN family protein [Lachnospiraceae bacterium]|nr:YraN family protein [Robinsoniella sp.]MDY3767089.1 YraN family protein [Lachnospiraceae bacterium]